MYYSRMNQLSNHTESTVLQFLSTANMLERQLDRTLSMTRGVSFSEYRLLNTLSNASAEGCPRVALAEALGVTASAVTRALKPLEKLGLVTTAKNARDARQSRAKITTAGLELLDDSRGILRDELSHIPLNSLDLEAVNAFRDRLNEFSRS